MSRVYHEQDFNPILDRERTFPDDFLLVAEVDSDDLGDIFHLTNHIDAAWYENEGVNALVRSRSTSSGDVVVLSDGRVFACRSVGWSYIGDEKDQPLKFQTKLVTFGDGLDEEE